MQTFDYSFTAGEPLTFPSGRFFMVIESTDDLDVSFFRKNSSINENAKGVPSGFYVEFAEQFDSARVTSATNQSCKIAVSHGRGGINTTSTSILGTVTTVDEVHPENDLFSTYSAAGTTNTIVVSGGANTNGVIIYSAVIIPNLIQDPAIFAWYPKMGFKVDPLGLGIGMSVTNPLHTTLAVAVGNGFSATYQDTQVVNNCFHAPHYIPAGQLIYLAAENVDVPGVFGAQLRYVLL